MGLPFAGGHSASQKERIMDQSRKVALAFGVSLILFGAFLLVVQFVPGLGRWIEPGFWWPLTIAGLGGFLLLLGLLVGAPGLAVPACVLGGLGLMLFWQNTTGNWDTWAYAWTLIPGFVGVGIVLTGLLSGKPRQVSGAGLWLIAISALLFGLFGALLGGPGIFRTLWPLLLIAAGIFLLLRSLVQHR
jgi:hypothetical protein